MKVLLTFFCLLSLLSAGLSAQIDPAEIEMDETTRAEAAADSETEESEEQQAPDSTEQLGPNLRLVGRSYGDSVVLRWGVVDHAAWKIASRAGFVLERLPLKEFDADRKSLPWELITPEPLIPLSLSEWRARHAADDTLVAAAVQAYHGGPVVSSDDPFGSIYEMYVQQTNMHGFAHLLADFQPYIADGLALRYADKNVKTDAVYMYRIRSLADDPNTRIDTALALVTAHSFEPVPGIINIDVSERELEVELRWDKFEHMDAPFSGYVIEQSLDGGNSFRRLNSLPFIPAETFGDGSVENGGTYYSYRVKLEENYRPAWYRIRGLNAFGELSDSSAVIEAMGRDKTPPKQPRMEQYEIVDGGSIKINWTIDSANPDPDLDGFFVAKSLDPEGPFEPISAELPTSARSFVDEGVADLAQHYYVVGAFDTAANSRLSAPILGIFPDSIPPATVAGLRGTIDSSGFVTLTWNANTERDLQGYRVFYAHQDDHEYQQLTTDIGLDTVFVDSLTLRTLSKDIYYRVVALDWNFNHSGWGKSLLLKKPDIVPPAAPLITEVITSDSSVTLSWHNSPSEDVSAHLLLRRASGAQEWQTLVTIEEAGQRSYADKSALQSQLYEYALEARDESGLTSGISNIITARVYDSGIRERVGNLSYRYDTENGRIILSWSYGAGSHQFYVYKAIGDGSLVLLQSLPGSVTEFIDTEVAAGVTYRYAIKVVTDDGGESAMAATETIRVE